MTASLSRIAHMVWKEVIQMSRDRRMFGLTLIMPLAVSLVIFAVGIVSPSASRFGDTLE